MFLLQALVAFFEVWRFDIAYAQAITARFIHVGGADSLEGGPDLAISLGVFAGRIQ
jgi:hypothetical protein